MDIEQIEPHAIDAFLSSTVQADLPNVSFPSIEDVISELTSMGVVPGHGVMVSMPNGRAYITVVMALLALRAVPVLLPWSSPPSRISRMADLFGTGWLITSGIFPKLAQGGEVKPLFQLASCVPFAPREIRRYQPGEIVLLTSGTSGIFSGCLFHMNSLLLNAIRHAKAIGQTASDTVLINLPMYYSYAFVAQLLATFSLGGKAIIAGPPFSPKHYLITLQEHRVTLSSVTPIMVSQLLETGHEQFPSTLQRLTVGGSVLAPSSVARLLAVNEQLQLYITYGLTQAGPRVATLAAHQEPPHRYASVGLPLPGVEVSLKKNTANDVCGSLVVTTDTGMRQKISNVSDHASPVVTGKQSIATGDVFEQDHEGYLYFMDREPSFIFNRGEKVYLKSICELAQSIPGVVKAEAWVDKGADEQGEFMLDLYCKDPSLQEVDIRRALSKILLRAEQPSRLMLHPESYAGWSKSATPSNSVNLSGTN